MDRAVMGGRSTLIEGMAIAGFACAATKGYIYVRAEYQAVEKLNKAIKQARLKRILGTQIANSSFTFDVEVRLWWSICLWEATATCCINWRK